MVKIRMGLKKTLPSISLESIGSSPYTQDVEQGEEVMCPNSNNHVQKTLVISGPDVVISSYDLLYCHECKTCGQRFKERGDLASHRRSHRRIPKQRRAVAKRRMPKPSPPPPRTQPPTPPPQPRPVPEARVMPNNNNNNNLGLVPKPRASLDLTLRLGNGAYDRTPPPGFQDLRSWRRHVPCGPTRRWVWFNEYMMAVRLAGGNIRTLLNMTAGSNGISCFQTLSNEELELKLGI